jgi:hypothetical protein
MNEQLQSEKMIPFNQAAYTQTLNVPSTFEAHDGKLLTVQFC